MGGELLGFSVDLAVVRPSDEVLMLIVVVAGTDELYWYR